jgi:hypothetical protein
LREKWEIEIGRERNNGEWMKREEERRGFKREWVGGFERVRRFEWMVGERRDGKDVFVPPMVTSYGPYAGAYRSYASISVTKQCKRMKINCVCNK